MNNTANQSEFVFTSSSSEESEFDMSDMASCISDLEMEQDYPHLVALASMSRSRGMSTDSEYKTRRRGAIMVLF